MNAMSFSQQSTQPTFGSQQPCEVVSGVGRAELPARPRLLSVASQTTAIQVTIPTCENSELGVQTDGYFTEISDQLGKIEEKIDRLVEAAAPPVVVSALTVTSLQQEPRQVSVYKSLLKRRRLTD